MYREFAELHEARHWWFVGRRRIIGALLASRFGPRRDLRILDIGCGTGGMIPVLTPYGRLTAVDPAEAALRYCRERYGGQADLARVDFPRERPPGGDYDLITLFDVLEHLDDDASALRAAAGLLRSGGVLLATVPAHAHLWSPHDTINEHRRRYSRRQLRDRIGDSGLSLERLSFFNFYLYPVVYLARRLRRRLARQGDRRSDFRIEQAWLNRGLAALFGSERHLLARWNLPAGVSLLVVARREGDP